MSRVNEKRDLDVSDPKLDDGIGRDIEEIGTHSDVRSGALLRKLDRKLIPALGILYLLSFLDRSNVANAKLDGLTTDLHMSGDQYLNGLTLFFVGYVIFEVPWNTILKLTSPKIWLPTITLVWGIVATLMGLTQNLAGFYAVRFFLGVTEGGLFPGAVYCLSMWYKRNERQFRISLFFSAASLAGAFGGILAWGIGHMSGVAGYKGWRWIFIIEGLITIVIAAAAYWFVPNFPDTAKFLSDDERTFLHERLKQDSDATDHEGFSWANVLAALTDSKCWLYGLTYHTLSLPLYTLSLFLPTIIKSLGYTAAAAQLLTVPPYALAFVLTFSIAIISERYHIRAPFIIGSSLLACIGYCILLSQTHPTHRPGVSYVGTFFAAAGIYPAVALTLSWPAINVSGQTKRAVAGAMQIMIGNIGAVIGTQLYRAEDSPRYVLGHSFALGYLLANCIVVTILWVVLRRENARRDKMAADQVLAEGELWKGDVDLRWRFRT